VRVVAAISAGPEGQTQILFFYQSTMTFGPRSNMVIDEFVYDPNAGTGARRVAEHPGAATNPAVVGRSSNSRGRFAGVWKSYMGRSLPACLDRAGIDDARALRQRLQRSFALGHRATKAPASVASAK
jgi:hypothetical protein